MSAESGTGLDWIMDLVWLGLNLAHCVCPGAGQAAHHHGGAAPGTAIPFRFQAPQGFPTSAVGGHHRPSSRRSPASDHSSARELWRLRLGRPRQHRPQLSRYGMAASKFRSLALQRRTPLSSGTGGAPSRPSHLPNHLPSSPLTQSHEPSQPGPYLRWFQHRNQQLTKEP